MHEAAEIAGGVQLFVEPGTLDLVGIGGQVCRSRFPLGERLHHGFRGQHAAFHRSVVALDFHRVESAGIAADQQAAGKVHLRQGVVAAFGNGARTVTQA